MVSKTLRLLTFLIYRQPIETLLNGKALLCLFVSFNIMGARADFGSIVDIGIAGDLYLVDESVNNGQGFVNLLIQNSWSEKSQLWIDVGAGGLIGETATSYFKAPQFYYRLGKRSAFNLTIGRALYDWSAADTFWNLGMTQPIFKWNKARPEQQGLTGAFLTIPVAKNLVELTLFGSFLFLPTQGASFEITNGKITSSNPWFSDPVEIIDVSGQKVDLNYQLDLPKSYDVVNQSSYGVLLGTPKHKKGFLLSGYYLNKPKNDLVLPFQGALNLSSFNGDIVIFPRVARHQTAGIDIGWNKEKFKTVLSWIYEGDISYNIPDDTTYPIFPEQNIFSFNQLLRISHTQRIWLAYLKTDRSATQIGGVFSGANIDTFENRNRFDEAARLKWEGLLFRSKSIYRVNASLSYTQSLVADNAWVSGDIRWSVYKGAEVFSMCDFFGGSDSVIVNRDFLSGYQNNDRCLVGGHYAF